MTAEAAEGAHGFRRVLSLRSLFDAGRAVVKVTVVTVVTLLVLRELLPRAGVLVQLTPPAAFRLLVAETGRISLLLAASLMVVAVFDLLWTRYEFARHMRMSRRELRDELRHLEGDPRIRSRMRVLRREMLSRLQAVQRTREADFVVVNPVHVAVALRYRRGETAAPVVVAKGVGVVVRIRRVAVAHGDLRVSIASETTVSQPPLAVGTAPSIGSVVVSNSSVDVREAGGGSFVAGGDTVADLVQALLQMRIATRDVISILRAVKAAGALHAELVVQ